MHKDHGNAARAVGLEVVDIGGHTFHGFEELLQVEAPDAGIVQSVSHGGGQIRFERDAAAPDLDRIGVVGREELEREQGVVCPKRGERPVKSSHQGRWNGHPKAGGGAFQKKRPRAAPPNRNRYRGWRCREWPGNWRG